MPFRIWLTTLITGPWYLLLFLVLNRLSDRFIFGLPGRPSGGTSFGAEGLRLLLVYAALLLYGALLSFPFYYIFKYFIKISNKINKPPLRLAFQLLTSSVLVIFPFWIFYKLGWSGEDASTVSLPAAYIAGSWTGLLREYAKQE